MTILIPKRPNDVRQYVFDWSRELGDDAIETYTLSVTAGAVQVSSSENSAHAVYAVLVGGIDGSVSTLLLQITTAGGQTFQRDLSLFTSNTANVIPATSTKGQIVAMAYEEAGLPGYDLDITPQEQASALRRLDSLMAMWAGPGVNLDLGYNQPPLIGGSNLDDWSGIPDMALDAVTVTLSMSIAPGIGKTLSAEARVRLQQSMNATRATYARIPNRHLPAGTLRGAGQKPLSTWWPYRGRRVASGLCGSASSAIDGTEFIGTDDGDILGTDDGGLLGT